MNVVVLLRRLRGAPKGTAAASLLGRCDEAALSTALAWSAHEPGTRVTVVAAGATDIHDDVLRRALALGADRAVRVEDPELDRVDYHGVARVLAAVISRIPHDLVLAGDRSEDEGQGAVGPAVAEFLGVPHLTGALSLAPGEGSTLLATRRDAGALRTLVVPLPALVTVVAYPGTRAVLEDASPDAANAPIELVDLEGLGLQAAEIRHRDRCLGKVQAVRVRRNATIVTKPDELVRRLRDDHLL